APLALAGIAADAATAEAGTRYLYAFLPSLALMFPMAALGSALRASGVVKPTMVLQTLSVLLNVVLAPVLIAGWGTGAPLGVTGAGLASSIAVAVTVVALVVIFPRVQSYLRVTASGWTPRLSVWGRIIGIGLPAAGEFFIMFLVFGVVYAVIRRFGPEAQAGFGIGSRVMMSIFLPAMAIAFAAAPIAGQNYGAGLADRVRHTFRQAALIGSGIMVVLTLLCHLRPDLLVAPFTNDAKVAETAATYLKIISWNFVATGLVFACSGLFQALGDTRPAFFSSLTRLLTFAIPAIWLSYQPWATLEHVWYVSLSSVLLQAVVSLLLLHALMAKKLAKPAPDLTKAPAPAV
ncbi:MAG: MATE family efflux transporter, partial [Caulobacteraceae bacterium]